MCARGEKIAQNLPPYWYQKMHNVERLKSTSWELHFLGGGGFFLVSEDFGRMFNNSFCACAFFFSSSEVEISSHTLIPLFGQDQSTVAQCADCNCLKMDLSLGNQASHN